MNAVPALPRVTAVQVIGRYRRPGSESGESPVIPVRMDADLLEALNERAPREGVSRSEAIRKAVRAWAHAA